MPLGHVPGVRPKGTKSLLAPPAFPHPLQSLAPFFSSAFPVRVVLFLFSRRALSLQGRDPAGEKWRRQKDVRRTVRRRAGRAVRGSKRGLGGGRVQAAVRTLHPVSTFISRVRPSYREQRASHARYAPLCSLTWSRNARNVGLTSKPRLTAPSP